MFDSDLLRFVTAIVFLAVYSVLEHHLQLGIVASAALSLTLHWRCNSVLSMMLLAADLFFYCCSYKDFGCIPFLMSETLLICTRSRSEVRGSISSSSVTICAVNDPTITETFYWPDFLVRTLLTLLPRGRCGPQLI